MKFHSIFYTLMQTIILVAPSDSKLLSKVDCQMFVNNGSCTVIGSPSVSINLKTPCLFHCSYDPSKVKTGLVRFHVHLYSSSANASVSISARQDREITSWNLPETFAEHGTSQRFQTIEEALCPSRESNNDTIYFRLETSSIEDVVLNISLIRTPYTIEYKKPVQITATPVSSWFKFYNWTGHEEESVLVTAKNFGKKGKDICAYLAIQNAQCPVASTKASITSGNTRFLSFQRQGGMIAKKSDFPDGIFIIVLSMPSDAPCTGVPEEGQNITTRKKTVELIVMPHTTVSENWFGFFITGLVVAVITIVNTLLLKKVFYRVQTYERLESSEEGGEDEVRVLRTVSGLLIRESLRGSTRRSSSGQLQLDLEEEQQQRQQQQELRLELEQDEEEGIQQQQQQLFVPPSSNPSDRQLGLETQRSLIADCGNPENEQGEGADRQLELESAQSDGNRNHVLPTELIEVNSSSNPLYMGWWMQVTEFRHRDPLSNFDEIGLHKVLIIISSFMTLVVLGILKFLLYDYNNGSEDKCYFNTLCMSSLWFFPNFSPVFTNLAYIAFGCSFYHNSNTHEKWRLSKNTTVGVYKCYDVFKSLAVGLILVGFMSSFYHICPNSTTLPFDMMFIYVEVIILIVVTWGLRHGTVIGHVYSTVGFFALTLLTAEIKYWIPYQIFWTFVILFQFALTISIAATLCKFGTWTFSPVSMYQIFKKWNTMSENFQTLLREEYDENSHDKKHFTVIRTLICLVANVILMIFGPTFDMEMYFYILLTCIVNMVLYLLNYIGTKTILCKERVCMLSSIYLTVGAILWGVAMYFLSIENSDVETTPAVSHYINAGCRLFDVFSAHDIWHLTSALASYATLLGILTLDDDMAEADSKMIPVF